MTSNTINPDELPGERSARIVREMREQERLDKESAEMALDRFRLWNGGEFPPGEEGAYQVGYVHALRDVRKLDNWEVTP